MSNGKPARDIRERAYAFALRIIKKLCRHLEAQPGVCRELGRQVLRSGTSIGANLEEALAGQSKADFIHKNEIALKEARETVYWLHLLADSAIVPAGQVTDLKLEAEEVNKIIGAIVSTAKKNHKLAKGNVF